MSYANVLTNFSGKFDTLSVTGAGYSGSATLAAGTVTVTVPGLPASAIVLLQPVSAAVGASNDALSVGAIANAGAANASFTIYSSDNTDVRVVKWLVVLTA